MLVDVGPLLEGRYSHGGSLSVELRERELAASVGTSGKSHKRPGPLRVQDVFL